MIENDEQFQAVLKEYAKSKGVEYDDFCRDIACDKCLFKDMDNFKEWARKAKAKCEVKRDDEIS